MQERSTTSRFLDAINSHDANRVREVLAPDFVFEEVAGAGEPSVDALLHELSMVHQAFPDVIFRPGRETIERSRTYLEVRGFGTHKGKFLDVDPTGAPALVSGVFNVEPAGGVIRRLRLTVDFGGLRRQLLLAARTQALHRS